MTQPAAPVFVKLGPGTLEIGATGAEIDVSCYVQNAKVANTKNTGTTVRYLCGTSVPGVTTYDFTLTGQIDVDVDAGALGLFDYAWNHPGETVDFTFVPNTVNGASATGQLILDPFEFGADEFGANLTSPFSFGIVGKPVIAYKVTPPGAAAQTESETERELAPESVGV